MRPSCGPGVSESDARKYGWTKPDLKMTWKDIADASKAGKLNYAISNPATSNQGFMALMGVVASAAQKSEALTAADVDRAAISGFIKGYKLVGDNSSYLSEKFIEQQNTRVNAFINYESWLLSLNQSGKRPHLIVIRPDDHIVQRISQRCINQQAQLLGINLVLPASVPDLF